MFRIYGCSVLPKWLLAAAKWLLHLQTFIERVNNPIETLFKGHTNKLRTEVHLKMGTEKLQILCNINYLILKNLIWSKKIVYKYCITSNGIHRLSLLCTDLLYYFWRKLKLGTHWTCLQNSAERKICSKIFRQSIPPQGLRTSNTMIKQDKQKPHFPSWNAELTCTVTHKHTN